MITSLRRLELSGLEQHLTYIQSELESGNNIKPETIVDIENALQIYLQAIEEELI